MSEKLVSLMRAATAPLHVWWEEPAALRRRAGRRKVRLRGAVALASVAVLGASGGIAFGPAGAPLCVEPVPAPSPPRPEDLPQGVMVAVGPPSVRVYHPAIGVAESVADDLRTHGFHVPEAARTDESVGHHSAVIRYGPGGEADARLLRAHLIPDEVIMMLDPGKQGPGMDLILGIRFTRLAPLC